MNVASLKLCKELHELSGWGQEAPLEWYTEFGDITHKYKDAVVPAYDLGYVLRKLPKTIRREKHGNVDFQLWFELWQERPCIGYMFGGWQVFAEADTPEDATCKLAIELFKQDILERTASIEKNSAHAERPPLPPPEATSNDTTDSSGNIHENP